MLMILLINPLKLPKKGMNTSAIKIAAQSSSETTYNISDWNKLSRFDK